MINNTRISEELASISFLKSSAAFDWSGLLSNLFNFVTPSTSLETSFPKFSLISLIVAFVSSIVSCKRAHITDDVSRFNSASILATSIG